MCNSDEVAIGSDSAYFRWRSFVQKYAYFTLKKIVAIGSEYVSFS